MNRHGEKSVPISGLDDKREITVLLAVTLAGEYLPPQLLYQGKTERCHPAIESFHLSGMYGTLRTIGQMSLQC